MLKKIQKEISSYSRYFLEADDNEDQVSVTVAPRKNRGTDYGDDSNKITVAPRQNRGTDYGEDDDTETDVIDNTEDITDGPDTGDGEADDYSAGDDNTEDNQDDDATDNADGGEDEETTDEETPDGPDTGDGETDDYSADDSSDTDSDIDDSSEETEEETEDEKQEKTKKFHMYKRYLKLYNSIDSFLEKLNKEVKDDPVQNAVIKTVSNNITDVYDAMFDYMTIKYKTQSYVQILIYFETIISIIKLNFELLRNNKINLKQ